MNSTGLRTLRILGRSVRVILAPTLAITTAVAGSSVTTERVNNGPTSLPVFATFAPGDPDHLYVVEQAGLVRVLELATGNFRPDPLLNLQSSTIYDGGNDERGLLGLAFHPNFAENGRFYTYSSEAAFAGGNHASYVRGFQVSTANPFVADPASQQTVLRFSQPQQNHNGGWIGFSPLNNYLHIATGDGGNYDDLGSGHTDGSGNAQDVSDNLLGKILRIDVNGDSFPGDEFANYAIPSGNPFVGVEGNDDEIFAYGLRNPFRSGFDRQTGDLFIGDVGQDAYEEVNVIPAESVGGENFGWRLREGFVETPPSPFGTEVGGPRPPGNVEPIHVYPHNGGPRSITGGYVYRGPVAELRGQYFFADFVANRIWSLEYDGSMTSNVIDRTTQLDPPGSPSIRRIASFAEDAVGNLYIIDRDGEIWKIVGPTLSADFDKNGTVDGDDFLVWQRNFGTMSGASPNDGDADGDGDVDGDDFLEWQIALGDSPTQASTVPEPGTGMLMGFAMTACLIRFRRSTDPKNSVNGSHGRGIQLPRPVLGSARRRPLPRIGDTQPDCRPTMKRKAR